MTNLSLASKLAVREETIHPLISAIQAARLCGSETTIAVTNISPVPTIGGPASGVPFESLSYTGSFTDPGTTGETYTFAWKVTGPGGFSQTGTNQSFSFMPTALGSYSLSFKVTDDAGGSGTIVKAVSVVRVLLETDPGDPSKTAMVVGGSTGADNLVVQRASAAGFYTVLLNGTLQGPAMRPTGHIIVYGGDGNDNIKLLNNSFGFVTVPAILFGGTGNDALDGRGSTANNILIGGDGDDTLLDGTGFNILIGGLGIDNLNRTADLSYTGNLGNDILLGEATTYDANTTALLALMQEWGSSHTLAQKTSFLSGTPGGLNGSFFLNGSTIINDGVTDLIFSDPLKQNWLP